MEEQIAIQATGVSKKFKLHSGRNTTSLKSFLLSEMWRRKRGDGDVRWALRDVDLAVAKGRVLGVIGSNGSGKSTLLRVLNRTLRPDGGAVESVGRIAALVELGVGFHPELSGRENAFINGIILGLSKREIRERIDEIIDFAEIGARADDPVRTYSTGMVLRLGFSVASTIDPDILLLDEILSVGDASFARKCHARMLEVKARGRTLVIVSHDLHMIESWSDEVIWLREGRVAGRGAPAEVIADYLAGTQAT